MWDNPDTRWLRGHFGLVFVFCDGRHLLPYLPLKANPTASGFRGSQASQTHRERQRGLRAEQARGYFTNWFPTQTRLLQTTFFLSAAKQTQHQNKPEVSGHAEYLPQPAGKLWHLEEKLSKNCTRQSSRQSQLCLAGWLQPTAAPSSSTAGDAQVSCPESSENFCTIPKTLTSPISLLPQDPLWQGVRGLAFCTALPNLETRLPGRLRPCRRALQPCLSSILPSPGTRARSQQRQGTVAEQAGQKNAF